MYAVASGKGGSGKTTTAINLASVFSATGRDVALVDADLAMSDMADVLNLSPEHTIHDVLTGDAELSEAFEGYPVEFGDVETSLDVLAGSDDLLAFADADPKRVADVLKTVSAAYDIIVVDTATGLTEEVQVPLENADEVVVVSSPERAAVSDTRKTVEFAEKLGTDVSGVVVTDTARELPLERVPVEVGSDLLGTVPDLRETEDPVAAYEDIVKNLLIGDVIAGSGSSALSTATDESDSDDTEQTDDSTLEVNKSLSEVGSGGSGDGEAETDADDSEAEADEDPEIGGAFGRFVDVVGGGSDDS